MKVVIPGGEVFDLGATETTPTVGITDYSRRVTDDYGVTTVVARGFARRMSVRLGVPTELADAVLRKLAALRASTAQWVANDAFACLAINGFLKDFDFDFSAPPLSYCTLTVEGLTETEPFVDAGGDPAPFGQTSTLRLLQPATITDAALVSSNVPETDYPAWASGATYALGARVIKAATHRIYESAVAGNVGNDPVAADGKWLDIGPTNRWALFDRALGSTTTAASPIAVTVSASPINAVALLDLVGTSVRVQANGYDRTQAVGAGAMTFLDLPAGTKRVTVTLTGSGAVSVGTLLVGKLVGLGVTEAAPTAGITDYSRKDVDDFGAVTIVERAWAKRMTAKGLISTAAIDSVFSRIAAVRATPSLWIGQDGYDSLTIYGFFKTFEIEAGDTVSKLSLSIEGLSTAGKIEPFAPGGGNVNWDDIGDPNGTKPANNATNGRDPNSPLGSTTVGDFERQLAAARAQLAYINETTIPTINTAVASGKQAAADALAAAVAILDDKDAFLNRRIDSVSASGGYDDTNVYAEVRRVDQTAISRDGTIGQRIDSVITNYQTADTNTNARVDQVATSASNANTAVADLTTSVNTRFGGVNTTLSSYDGRITALSTSVQGYVGRTDTLETQLNGNANSNLLARATSEATAAVDAKVGVAVAQSTATLSARIRQGSPNLLVNSDFHDTQGWSFVGPGWQVLKGSYLGPFVQKDGTGTAYAYQDVQVQAGISYSFGASFGNDSAGLMVIDVQWLNASNALISAAGRVAGGTDWGRVASAPKTAPTGAAKARVLLLADSGASGTGRARQVQFQEGAATDYQADQSLGVISASITQQAGVLAGINGRTSVYWSVTGTTPDGSTTIQLSKADGTPGLFYIGANLLVDGNAIFNGTVTIRALDRTTMTSTSSGSVSGSYGGVGTGPYTYIPNLGADMAIKSGGSIYLTFTGNIAATTDASGSIYASFEIINAADTSVLASVRLPTPGFGPGGRLDNFVIRILNVWGDLTIRWRVATRATGSTWAIVQNPQCSVYWTAL